MSLPGVQGITHILQVAAAFKPAYPSEFIYKVINVLDMPFANISIHFPEALAFINQALSYGGKVLVHCYAGVSRSATIIVAYLMQEKHMTFMEAMQHVRRRRPIACPNFGFQRQLMDFEKALRRKNKEHFTPQKEKERKRPATATVSRAKSASKLKSIPITSMIEKAAYLKHMDELIEAVQKRTIEQASCYFASKKTERPTTGVQRPATS